MDPSSYKSLEVPRGYTYGYHYQLPSSPNLPYILFLHGFPSTSQDWSNQVSHFTALGYGVIAPDMLGYGKTDKPADSKEYKGLEIAKDILAILDEERLEKVIVVAHDWGCDAASRLVDIASNRLVAAAFLAVGYWPVQPQHVLLEDIFEYNRQVYGSDLYGYWTLFNAEDGHKIIHDSVDSLYDILFPASPETWKTHMNPKDAMKDFVSSSQRLEGLAPFWTDEDRNKHKENIMQHGGFLAPTNYYKAQVAGLNVNPDADSNHKIDPHLPVFYGAALRDYVCMKAIHETDTRRAVSPEKLTVHDFDTGHWVMLEKPEELNAVLERFFEGGR